MNFFGNNRIVRSGNRLQLKRKQRAVALLKDESTKRLAEENRALENNRIIERGKKEIVKRSTKQKMQARLRPKERIERKANQFTKHVFICNVHKIIECILTLSAILPLLFVPIRGISQIIIINGDSHSQKY